MTRKLYYDDVYLSEFDAVVTRVGDDSGRPWAVLDQTAFYPEGGGQAWDTGFLGERRVLEVQESGGDIYHYLDNPLAEGVSVRGVLDWEERFSRMQQHLGQHILSAVAKTRYDANSVGVHFGAEINTLDFDKPLTAEQLEEAVIEVNEAIQKNLTVRTSFPDLEEIRARSRKKIPLSDEPIRIVEIEGVDYITCCGTHPARTGEVGLLMLFKHDAYKGGVRLYFSCGMPALRKLCRVWEDTAAMQRIFSIGDGELPARVEKLMEEQREWGRERHALISRLMELEAARLRSGSVEIDGRAIIAGTARVENAGELKCLFDILTREPAVVLLGGRLQDSGMLMFGCHKEMSVPDLRLLFRRTIESIGGKGGGSDFLSQGMCPDPDALEEAVISARDALLSSGPVCR